MPGSGFIKILDTVDSTNNYAMERVHAGLANHGMAWFAKEQTAGKGQRGKTWKTEKGSNVIMSIVLQPERINSNQQFFLSAAVALAVFELFSKYAGEETKIKWPNDLYWRDRKAGGVLIETIFHGKTWKWAVIGIGINVNQLIFDDSLQNPVSLRQITGREFDTIALANELYDQLMKNCSALGKGAEKDLLEDYNRNLYRLNSPVTLKQGGRNFTTEIKGVSAEGRLLTSGSSEQQFDFGEVEWVM